MDPWILEFWKEKLTVIFTGSLDPWILRILESEYNISLCGFDWIPGSLDPGFLEKNLLSFLLNPWILGSLKSRILSLRYHSMVLAGSLDPWNLTFWKKKNLLYFSLDPWILRISDFESKISFFGFGWILGSLDP